MAMDTTEDDRHLRVPLWTLEPGTRFRVGGSKTTGTLIRVSPGAAYVRLDAITEVTFTTRYGEKVEFDRPAETVAISRGTSVIPFHKGE